MMKGIISIRNILFGIGVLTINSVIYIAFGLLLMNYDDFYDESKGYYWSYESMNFYQKVIFIGFNLWNILNLILIVYLMYRIVIHYKKKKITQNAFI
jgi:hypothetical protein